ncbi:diguanylate cyclase [Leptolyngbya sp. FACHB-16]|uniref:diguanylate cyclase domain-containing protein n=1 Tax=unclassified Leptolyngbya TaxID=2650499 RepID=UPI002410E1E3|nr:diguanylate cyclase [Leptolyngbya sp. FACHB-16]
MNQFKSVRSLDQPVQGDVRYLAVDPCHLQYLTAMGVASSISLPILYQNQLWGLLVAHHSEPQSFKESQLQTVQLLVDQLPIAIAQADLMQQAQQQALHEAALNQLNQLLNGPQDKTGMWQTALEQISHTLSAIGGRLYITASPTGQAMQLYTWGEQPTQAYLETSPFWQALIDWQGVLATSHRQVTEVSHTTEVTSAASLHGRTSEVSYTGATYTYQLQDLQKDARLQALVDACEPTSIRSLLIIPLQYQQYVGCLTLFRAEIETERLWAGRSNPDERNVLPRQSFEAWREIKSGQVDLWTPAQIKLAQSYGLHLYITVLQQRVADLLHHHASHDLLTGLPNRLLFDELLSLALVNIHHQGNMLAVMMLDLDRFKTINDTLGHITGDRLLQAVTQRLRDCLRDSHTLARWGDDEFTVLLPQICSAEDAIQVAQQILDTLKVPFQIDTHELHITASIGIALAPYDGEDVGTLLKCADMTLHRTKQQGKNSYLLYTPTMNRRSLEGLLLGNHLYKALGRQELLLHYQPQIDLKAGKVVGMEALLRWQHPEMGMIPPTQFIPFAEETGLICDIGEWVLRTACTQNRQWQEAGLPPLRISVNLSVRQFQQPNLVQTIARTLQETGLEPHYLELEITESLIMQDVELAVAILRDLQRLGIHIAMDDFGTGYSSLSALMHLPVNTLKIDQSFIQNLNKHTSNRAIISSVIALGHGLHLKLIAEGVETVEQLEFLRQNHCDVVQGYLFSKPLTTDGATQLLYKKAAPSQMELPRPTQPVTATFPIPPNEAQRLAVLSRYQVLDTPPEATFNQLTHLAAQICQTPMAWISLVDEQRQWFKSIQGLELTETARTDAFCAHTILKRDLLLVPDTQVDPRFKHYPVVTKKPHLRFYAGAPLVNAEGFILGALCVADSTPRILTSEQQESLRVLAEQVMTQLELRRHLLDQQQRQELLPQSAIAATQPAMAISYQYREALTEQMQLAQLVMEIGEILNRNEPIFTLLQACATTLTHHLNAAFVGFWMRHPTTDVLELQASDGTPALDSIRLFKADWIAEQGQPFQTNRLLEHLPLSDRPTAIQEQLVAFTGYPLVLDHETTGVLSLFLRQPLPQAIIAQLGAIARSISHAVERQRTETLLQQQAERERLVTAIAQRIRQSLDLDEILNTTVHEVRHFLQTDRVIVFRFKPDWSGVVTMESVAEGYPRILRTVIDEPCFRNAYVPQYQQGRVRAIEDIYNAGLHECHINLLAEHGVRANLVVPILQGDNLWGLLIAHQCSGPRHWKELEISLLNQLATQVAIAIQQSELYQQVQRLAMVDGLTQVANRRHFDHHLDQVWQRMSLIGSPLSLILCDIDFFKLYNDTYGHPAGDECLQQVAAAIKHTANREDDFVARYGGEEFAIILSNTTAEGAFKVAERIRTAVKALQLKHQQSSIGVVSLSLGIATVTPHEKSSPPRLITVADQALYQAKQQGRDRVISAPG